MACVASDQIRVQGMRPMEEHENPECGFNQAGASLVPYGQGVRRRVVLITDIAFWERTYGSHTRIRGLARYLAEHHDLKVFFLKDLSHVERQSFARLKLPGARIFSASEFSEPVHNRPDILRKYSYFKHRNREQVSALHQFLMAYPAEVAVVEYIRLAYLKDACSPQMHMVLDLHDVMSERMMSLALAGLKPSIEISQVEERAILSHFDALLAISRADMGYLREGMGLETALYVPSAAEASDPRAGPPILPELWRALRNPQMRRVHLRNVAGRFGYQGSGKDPTGKRLLFLGANSKSNIKGLRWFLNQVWPLLQRDGFVLDVVGRVCDGIGPVPENVILYGQQDDIGRFFRRANISINPVFVGGGLKIKCIDALAEGVPCVTTFEGAAGLADARYAGLYVTGSRSEFAQEIQRLARDDAERARIAQLGPLFVASEFAPEVACKRFDAWLAALPVVERATP